MADDVCAVYELWIGIFTCLCADRRRKEKSEILCSKRTKCNGQVSAHDRLYMCMCVCESKGSKSVGPSLTVRQLPIGNRKWLVLLNLIEFDFCCLKKSIWMSSQIYVSYLCHVLWEEWICASWVNIWNWPDSSKMLQEIIYFILSIVNMYKIWWRGVLTTVIHLRGQKFDEFFMEMTHQ